MTDSLRRVDEPVMPAESVLAREPRLVVPEGWVIDEAACDRLVRQLNGAPSQVAGVVADVGELPPGASYRVHAEWSALEPQSAVTERHITSARGAMLIRPGVDFEVRDDVVEVGAGPLLFDAGAHVHDPWRPVGPLAVASELGRPPFPRRPVVVFLASECDDGVADWGRRLVNRLVRRDIEARLALPEVAEGLHLTRPCLPGEESIRALAPDVVVALDEPAAALAPSWCDPDRSTVMLKLDDDVSMTSALVSWQIAHASGRLRARISRRVDAPSLADLVRRLCAGPHPKAPTEPRQEAEGAVPEAVSGRSRIARFRTRATAVVVMTGPSTPRSPDRVDGLCDHLAATGAAVAVSSFSQGVPTSAREADLLILVGLDGRERLDDVVRERREAKLATVVDVTPNDLIFDSNAAVAAGVTPDLDPAVRDLALACGLATSPGGAVEAALSNAGVASHVLPSLLTRARVHDLRAARTIVGRESSSDLVVGWHVGSAGAPVPRSLDAVAEAVATVLAERAEARAEVVGDPARLPSMLRTNARVTCFPVEPEPETLARWTGQVWTPPVVGVDVADDLRHFVEAGYAGVPSLLSLSSRYAIDGYVSDEVTVARADQADDWATVLRGLLDDEQRRDERASEAFRLSDALYDPAASKAVIERFLGWARERGERL